MPLEREWKLVASQRQQGFLLLLLFLLFFTVRMPPVLEEMLKILVLIISSFLFILLFVFLCCLEDRISDQSSWWLLPQNGEVTTKRPVLPHVFSCKDEKVVSQAPDYFSAQRACEYWCYEVCLSFRNLGSYLIICKLLSRNAFDSKSCKY